MPLIQVRKKAQITIPSKIRKILGVKEGDYLDVEVEDNKIILTPKVIIDRVAPVISKNEEILKRVRKNQIDE